jgi:aspartate racemase
MPKTKLGNGDRKEQAMPEHIGIVACSAEGAALCYRTICREAADRMGGHNHPEITMHTHPLAKYMTAIRAGDWPAVAELMLSSARTVAAAGAEFAICPDNTIHQALPLVLPKSPIGWLDIAEVVVGEARRRGFVRLGITGTSYLTTGPVYPEACRRHGLAWEIPGEDERRRIDGIIFDELTYGNILATSRRAFYEIVAGLKARGCDAVVLGCTELPLLADEACPLPALDSTRLLAQAALDHSLRDPGA